MSLIGGTGLPFLGVPLLSGKPTNWGENRGCTVGANEPVNTECALSRGATGMLERGLRHVLAEGSRSPTAADRCGGF